MNARVVSLSTTASDLVSLTKPRLSSLVLFTMAGGIWLAPGSISPTRVVAAVLSTAGIVAAANALNCYLERDVDRLMARTRNRPLPSGRMDPQIALWFGLSLGTISLPALVLATNVLTGLLGLTALLLYVLVYTPMKARSYAAMLVGAVPGALPTLMGWTAVTGSIDPPALVLFAILFIWQIPHFIAISLFRKEEYAAAGLKSLPLERGDDLSRGQMAAYLGALVPVSVLLVPLKMAGTLYLVTALLLGLDLILSLPMAIIGGTYRATGLLERAGYIMAVHRLAFWLIPIGLIFAGGNLPVVALGRLICDLIVWAWMIRDLKRIHPELSFWPSGGRFSAGLKMMPAGLMFFIASIADYLANQGTLTVVQVQLGGTELAHFSTHRTLANMGRLVSGLLMASAWPEFTRLNALDQVAKLGRWFQSLSKLNGWLTGIIMIAVFPIARWMYGAWTLRRLELDSVIAIVLFSQTILWGFWNVGAVVLGATNRQARLVWILLLNAVANLLLTMILVRHAGARGAAVAALVADLAIAAWLVPWGALRLLNLSWRAYLRQMLVTFVFALIVPCCCGGLIWWSVASQPVRDLLVPALGAVISAGIMFLLLSEEERLIVREIINRGRNVLERARRSIAAGATSV